jgi:hypothetical protein
MLRCPIKDPGSYALQALEKTLLEHTYTPFGILDV